MDHHAIGAEVDPAFVGVLGDVEAPGPEITAAIELMPLRRWEDGAIDLVAAEHVLEDGPVLHDFGGDRGDPLAHAFLPLAHELVRRGARIEAKGDRDASE